MKPEEHLFIEAARAIVSRISELESSARKDFLLLISDLERAIARGDLKTKREIESTFVEFLAPQVIGKIRPIPGKTKHPEDQDSHEDEGTAHA